MQKKKFLFLILIFNTKIASAQFQGGFGMGALNAYPVLENPADNKKASNSFSFSPRVFANYVYNRKLGATVKLSFTNYGISVSQNSYSFLKDNGWHYPKPELSISGFYKKQMRRKVCGKIFGGGAFDFPFNAESSSNIQNTSIKVSYVYNSKPVFFLLSGAGLVFEMPGKYVYMDINLDYHFGLVSRVCTALSTNKDFEMENVIHSRMSYLALNIDFIFGKEKGKMPFKKKQKALHKMNYVM
jgi:hypothetical protein